ncbi:MAG TPA: adenylate/guanylate cyclase domain-containing protein [Nitrososphaeraceae archaeon]|jgi:adenylate cyclase
MDFLTFALQEQIRARVSKTLKDGVQLNMSTEESKKFLRRHVNTRTNLVIMIIDINNSTQMSLTLPESKFAQLLQTFAQEVSIAVSGYGGFVFKYEGDAVIVIFPADYDEIKACRNALNCSAAVLEILKNGINPIFGENELPEITVRTGLAFGPTLVVLYGKRLEKAHVDITGSSISLAAKIASIAKPNQVLVGELIYNIIRSSKDKGSLNNIKFREVRLDPIKWKYLSQSDPQSLYHVYEYLIN